MSCRVAKGMTSSNLPRSPTKISVLDTIRRDFVTRKLLISQRLIRMLLCEALINFIV